MGKIKDVKDRIAGKAKRLGGEILGDQELYEEGNAQEHERRKGAIDEARIKPLGNLDKLT